MTEAKICGMTLQKIKNKYPKIFKQFKENLEYEKIGRMYVITIPAKSRNGVFWPQKQWNIPAKNIEEALQNFLEENKNVDISTIASIELW